MFLFFFFLQFLDPIGAYEIDEKLVNSTCLKYYRKFWDRFVSRTNDTSFKSKSKQKAIGVDNEDIELETAEAKNVKTQKKINY